MKIIGFCHHNAALGNTQLVQFPCSSFLGSAEDLPPKRLRTRRAPPCHLAGLEPPRTCDFTVFEQADHAKLLQLARVSEGIAADGSFARQARRKFL